MKTHFYLDWDFYRNLKNKSTIHLSQNLLICSEKGQNNAPKSSSTLKTPSMELANRGPASGAALLAKRSTKTKNNYRQISTPTRCRKRRRLRHWHWRRRHPASVVAGGGVAAAEADLPGSTNSGCPWRRAPGAVGPRRRPSAAAAAFPCWEAGALGAGWPATRRRLQSEPSAGVFPSCSDALLLFFALLLVLSQLSHHHWLTRDDQQLTGPASAKFRRRRRLLSL